MRRRVIVSFLLCMCVLSGCREKQSDDKLSDMVMSEATITFGEYKDYSIKVIMTEGNYYTESETASSGGIYDENYDGEYSLQVLDSNGKIVDEISLNEDWGYNTYIPPLTINFPGKFELCVGDYNQDGYPDFTIGTYGSSSMNLFELYSVGAAGKIRNIGRFADTSKEFSIYLKQEERSTDFYTKEWNNAVGETETIRWVWNQETGKYEEGVDLTDEEMLEQFYDRFYGGFLTSEKMEGLSFDAVSYQESAYYNEITYYWEVVRGVTDISNFFEPLYFTDMKYYTEEEFEDATPVVIYLARNEIYAKHGYIFRNEDLNKYFRGCAWYQPIYTAEEFDDSVFNEYERKNLELLAELEKKMAEGAKSLENHIGENTAEKIDVETAWSYLKAACFAMAELEEKEYDENGNLQVVIGRMEMPFSEDDEDRPCESIVFFDSEDDFCYLFGHYYVYYGEDGDEVFATKTKGWYGVNKYTGEIVMNP